jgi:hypothetical protein
MAPPVTTVTGRSEGGAPGLHPVAHVRGTWAPSSRSRRWRKCTRTARGRCSGRGGSGGACRPTPAHWTAIVAGRRGGSWMSRHRKPSASPGTPATKKACLQLCVACSTAPPSGTPGPSRPGWRCRRWPASSPSSRGGHLVDDGGRDGHVAGLADPHDRPRRDERPGAGREARRDGRQAPDDDAEDDERPRVPTSARATAESMGVPRAARHLVVSEFFTKNRHLLGFDNPAKALLTTVKEAVDNSLDACEEAGILPELLVEIVEVRRDGASAVASRTTAPASSSRRSRRSSPSSSTARSSTASSSRAASRASASARRASTGSSRRASRSSSLARRGRGARPSGSSSASTPSATSPTS